MAIRSILINVADVSRSVEFYSRFLGTVTLEQDDERALLDAVTATLVLTRVDSAEPTSWIPDDLQAGFRHIGFKVADLRERAADLLDAGVRFQLEPIHAEGDVWITFFYDPDGTLVELVEGPLQYHEIHDRGAVDRDWGLGEPERPRFDHVASTAHDFEAAHRYFGELGYVHMASIHQPSDDRGFEINYLRNGDTSLEIFTFERAETSTRMPQLHAQGYLATEFEQAPPAGAVPVGTAAGREVYRDADGLLHAHTGRA